MTIPDVSYTYIIEELDNYNYGTMGITMGENCVGYFATYKWAINISLVLWNMIFMLPCIGKNHPN
jgi:hypothetical protein